MAGRAIKEGFHLDPEAQEQAAHRVTEIDGALQDLDLLVTGVLLPVLTDMAHEGDPGARRMLGMDIYANAAEPTREVQDANSVYAMANAALQGEVR